MKIIDGDALCIEIRKTADKRRDSSLQILAGLVAGFVHDMPEAEAYTESRQRIENMEKVNEDLEKRIAIMTDGGWIPVEKQLPEIKEGKEYFGTQCIVCDKYKQVFPLRYCLHNVRGREVHRWVYEDFRLYYGEVAYWMPIPEPPKEGET